MTTAEPKPLSTSEQALQPDWDALFWRIKSLSPAQVQALVAPLFGMIEGQNLGGPREPEFLRRISRRIDEIEKHVKPEASR